MLQWTKGCIYVFKLEFLLSLDRYPEVALLNVWGSAFNLLRLTCTVFHSGYINLHLHQQCTSVFYASLATIIYFFIMTILITVRWYLIVVLICVSWWLVMSNIFSYACSLSACIDSVQFSSVQSVSHVQFFATPCTAARQASLSINNACSLLKLMSIELVMPSNHLILCCPLLLLPSIFPGIRVFSNESVLHIRWPKYWNFSFSISPSNDYSFNVWISAIEIKEGKKTEGDNPFKTQTSKTLLTSSKGGEWSR